MFILNEDRTELINKNYIVCVSIACNDIEEVSSYEATAITTDGQTILLKSCESLEEAKDYMQKLARILNE